MTYTTHTPDPKSRNTHPWLCHTYQSLPCPLRLHDSLAVCLPNTHSTSGCQSKSPCKWTLSDRWECHIRECRSGISRQSVSFKHLRSHKETAGTYYRFSLSSVKTCNFLSIEEKLLTMFLRNLSKNPEWFYSDDHESTHLYTNTLLSHWPKSLSWFYAVVLRSYVDSWRLTAQEQTRIETHITFQTPGG